MRTALILHGKPSKDEYYDSLEPSASNAHWYPWLQKQLSVHGLKADTPEVPLAFDPTWDLWVNEVERFEINQDSLLIGHSTGGGFWIRYLSEHPEIYVHKLILVAPWLNVHRENPFTFFDFTVDENLIERVGSFIIFTSDNDDQDIKHSVNFLREKFPSANLKEFHDYGHFCLTDMKTVEFPELLGALLE